MSLLAQPIQPPAAVISLAGIEKLFTDLDIEATGTITKEELRTCISKRCGDSIDMDFVFDALDGSAYAQSWAPGCSYT